jgi:GlpG protein
MTNNRSKLRITFNAPAILTFALACVAVQGVNVLTQGASNRLLFSTYRSSLLNPLTWLRCVTHVLGHADWGHLLNNMMLLLVVGPAQEEKYGSANVVFVMLATAVATAVVNMVFFPNVALLGASGIVFAMILLSSITSTDGHTIPLTFILVAVLYIGQQVYEGLFVADNISQLGHIVGGLVGSALGFAMNRRKMTRYQR